MNKLRHNDVEQKINNLLQQIPSHPKQTIEEIIKLIGKRLLIFLRLLLENKQDAEDVFQEVFTIVYLKLSENTSYIKSINSSTNWIYTIAKNQALQLLRKKKIEKKHILGYSNLKQTQTNFFVSKNKTVNPEVSIIYEDLYNAITQLPVELKVPLLLRECLDLTYTEIAQIMDQNINQVAADIYKARKLLKELLSETKL